MVTANGHAKINLTLDILGKRPDGFHEVAMVMQSLALHDTVVMEKSKQRISLEIEAEGVYGGRGLTSDSTNLAWRAASLLQEEFGLGGVSMHLTKRIPIAAGLAGGSADAAAVLMGMNELYGLELDIESLCDFGARLGSDIPFCIQGGTMFASGRGEKLSRLPAMPEIPVVLAKPHVAVSTAWAYRTYDEKGSHVHPDNDEIQKEIVQGNWKAVSKLLCNVLESVTIEENGEISKYKRIMREHGALAAMMSGSGPTVFALVEKEEDAAALARLMGKETDAEVIVTSTGNGSMGIDRQK